MVEKNISKKHRIRNDILFVSFFLLIAAIGAIYLFFFRKQGTTVEVKVNGELYGVYSLNEDIEVDILSGKENSGTNCLIISGGKAYVESASCPDGICVSHRPVNRDGESIVCLPNGVVIAVSSDDADSPDVVV